MQPRFLEGCCAVFAWEIKTYILRPTTYVLLLASALLAGWSFSWLVTLLARGSDGALHPGSDSIALFLGPNVFLIGGCTVLIPLITMNAIADERRRANWELLLTAPVSTLAVVVGKFVAAWCLFITCLAPWAWYLVVLHGWNGKFRFLWNLVPWFDGSGLVFDPGPAMAGCTALAVVGATFVAVGLFCSGLCRGPSSAALLTTVAMATIIVVGLLPRVLAHWGCSMEQVGFIEMISCWGHLDRFSRGVIEPRVIAGHMTFCAGLLWVTAYVTRRVDEG
jgi:ABC-2 type transport system permease protein